MNNESFESDIVILGHVAKDIIEVDGIKSTSLGGGVYYGGIAGSQIGLKITVITRLNQEDFNILNVFKKNKVNVFAYPSEETSGLRNIYSSNNMEFRDYKPLGFAGLFRSNEIPDSLKTKFFVISSILAGEVDLELLDFIKKKYPHKTCLDMQGFIRFSKEGKVFYDSISGKEKKEIISKINVLKLDQTEAETLTGQKNITRAVKEIFGFGPKEILITHEGGIFLFTLKDTYHFPWKNKNSIGRTGRGDTAFISYLGKRITQSPEDSLKFAAALTSLKLEKSGPFNLPLSQVENLIKREY
ncbi:hypothetical protein LCGC14_0690640 [marine sediment metagenome]|uniref:Carbohydrate kinase PfkB domain-containing protein n=1 Tax=marine sediment metagenome TaxID=412755 RepID=A0A0F9QKL2_9ZZZZ|nr:hypothetical protein [bacterium]